VLDVSGECGSFHKHTMALVRMSAQMIENHLLAGSFPDCITLHFHSRADSWARWSKASSASHRAGVSWRPTAARNSSWG
jgi:transcriptional regulator of acetoin/glycerol metabolism